MDFPKSPYIGRGGHHCHVKAVGAASLQAVLLDAVGLLGAEAALKRRREADAPCDAPVCVIVSHISALHDGLEMLETIWILDDCKKGVSVSSLQSDRRAWHDQAGSSVLQFKTRQAQRLCATAACWPGSLSQATVRHEKAQLRLLIGKSLKHWRSSCTPSCRCEHPIKPHLRVWPTRQRRRPSTCASRAAP